MVHKKNLARLLLLVALVANTVGTNAQIFWAEDFISTSSDIPPGWEVFDNNAGGGLWEITNIGPVGPYATEPCDSTGTDDRWIMFDSATDCSGDQDPWIVTPPIDCSQKENVWLAFHQCYLNFYCETYIRISTDEATPLAEWDEIQINITGPNGAGPPEILLNITDYVAMEPTVYIAFEFRNVAGQAPDPSVDGCAYNWQVDDIVLYDEDPTTFYDLALSNNFYAIAPNAMWPVSQLEPFGFLSDVANNGQSDQTNVQVIVALVDESTNNNVHTETLDLTDAGFPIIAGGEIVENQLFPGDGFTPPNEVTTYTGQYLVNSDSIDAFPEDNESTFDFMVTENIFAKEDTASISIAPNSTNWPTGEPYSWSFGNHYYLPNGDGWWADEVSFALGNPSSVSGKKVTVLLFEWENIVFGSPTTIAPADRTQIGFSEYTITGFEGNGNLITVDLFDNLTGEKGVVLKDDAHYILMLSYAATDQTTPVAIAGSELKDYGAQVFRAEQLGQARYASILMIGELASGTFSTVGFGRDIVPTVRMHITDQTISVTPALPADNIVAVYPNPAKDKINIHLEMTSLQKEIELSVIDVNGKIHEQRNIVDMKTKDLQMDLSHLPTGSYFLQVDVVDGQRAVPFVIQK